jgi:hypothetical protein
MRRAPVSVLSKNVTEQQVLVRVGSRTVLQHLDVAHQFFVGLTLDNGPLRLPFAA